MVLPKLKRHLNAKNTLSEHDNISRHRNLNETERSVIVQYRNLNAPKICKITALHVQCGKATNRSRTPSIHHWVTRWAKTTAHRYTQKEHPHSHTHTTSSWQREHRSLSWNSNLHTKKLYQHLHKRCLNHLKWVYNNVLWSMGTANRSLPTFKTHFP